MARRRPATAPVAEARTGLGAGGLPLRALPWWAPAAAVLLSLSVRTVGPPGDAGSLVSAALTTVGVVVMFVGTWRQTIGSSWTRWYDTAVTSVWWSLGLSLAHACLLGVAAATVGFESPWGDALLVAMGVYVVWPAVAVAVLLPVTLLGGIALLTWVAVRSMGRERALAVSVVIILVGFTLMIGGSVGDSLTTADPRPGSGRSVVPLLVHAWTTAGPAATTVRVGSVTALVGTVGMLLGFRAR